MAAMCNARVCVAISKQNTHKFLYELFIYGNIQEEYIFLEVLCAVNAKTSVNYVFIIAVCSSMISHVHIHSKRLLRQRVCFTCYIHVKERPTKQRR